VATIAFEVWFFFLSGSSIGGGGGRGANGEGAGLALAGVANDSKGGMGPS
jgi:hypothetical protein